MTMQSNFKFHALIREKQLQNQQYRQFPSPLLRHRYAIPIRQ